MKSYLLLFLLILSLGNVNAVGKGNVYTFTQITTVREFENEAPITQDQSEITKSVRVDEVNNDSVKLSIALDTYFYEVTITNNTFGLEITLLPVAEWTDLAKNDAINELSSLYEKIEGLTTSNETVGTEFSLLMGGKAINETRTFDFYFSFVYDTETGVRTSFAASIREEFDGTHLRTTTLTEILISTTDPFPKKEERIPLLVLPILVSIISFSLLRRKIRGN